MEGSFISNSQHPRLREALGRGAGKSLRTFGHGMAVAHQLTAAVITYTSKLLKLQHGWRRDP